MLKFGENIGFKKAVYNTRTGSKITFGRSAYIIVTQSLKEMH